MALGYITAQKLMKKKNAAVIKIAIAAVKKAKNVLVAAVVVAVKK